MKSLILWHIPRTGTTSLRHAAHAAGIPELRSIQWKDGEYGLRTYSHLTPGDVIRAGLATESELNSVPSIMVVRNTWDRLVSLFHLFHQRGDPGLLAIANRFGPSFDEYLDWCISGEKETGQHEANYQCRAQSEWLDQRLDMCTIIRFSNLNIAWNRIGAHFGVQGELVHHNRSSHQPYQTYYTAEYRDKVADHYRKEIEHCEFTFD